MYLTKRTPEDHLPSRQASAEIEVTPAMIEAGAQVIFEKPSLCDDGWEELAELVYCAMEEARLRAGVCSAGAPSRRLVAANHQDRRS